MSKLIRSDYKQWLVIIKLLKDKNEREILHQYEYLNLGQRQLRHDDDALDTEMARC